MWWETLTRLARVLVKIVEDADIEFLEYRTWWGSIRITKRRRNVSH